MAGAPALFSKCPTAWHLKLELRPLLLHGPLPLPLLPARPLYPLVNPPQLHRKPRAQLLQAGSYAFNPFNLLPVRANHTLFSLPLFAKNIPMSPQKDVIPLIMQRHDLSTLEIGLRWEDCPEKVRGQKAERRAKIVEDQFRMVICRSSMAGQLLPFNPVTDAEVKCGTLGQMHEYQAGGFLLVFLENKERSVGAVGGEGGDFADGVFMAVAVSGARDVDTVGKEGSKKPAFRVEGGVEGCGDEGFGGGRGS